MDIVLLGLLVYSSNKEDPALDTPLRPGLTLVCLVNPLVLAVLYQEILTINIYHHQARNLHLD